MKRLPSLFLPILLVTLHVSVLVNLRFEAWPEMVVYSYLMHNGFRLYTDIVNPYPPLFNWFLSGFFALVGLSLVNLKLLTWSLIVLIDTLIYAIAFKKYGRPAALVGLLFFVIFQPLLDGNGLWFDLALVPILLLAFYWRSPLALAVGFFIKQSVIWFFPLFYRQWRKLFISFITLFAISYVLFAAEGSASDYLFWSWRFPFTLAPIMPGYKDFGDRQFWVIAIATFSLPLALFIATKPTRKTFSFHHPFTWLILSFPFLLPRFGLFHLQPALAFASLLVGHSWGTIKTLIQKKPVMKLAFAGYVMLVLILWARHIQVHWQKPTRFFEPIVSAQARDLADRTVSTAPIFLLNTPAQILWLSGRLPTKPWVDTFPWYYEVYGFQAKVLKRVTRQSPSAVIFTPYQNQGKFTPGSYRPLLLDSVLRTTFPNVTHTSYGIEIWSPD